MADSAVILPRPSHARIYVLYTMQSARTKIIYVVNIVKIDLTNCVPCYKPNDVMYITKKHKTNHTHVNERESREKE